MAKRTRHTNRISGKRGARPARSSGAARPASGLAPRPATPVDEGIPVDLPDDAPVRASASGLTEAEEQRAAEIEAELTARERAAIAESLRRRAKARQGEDADLGVNAPLTERMAHEYAYVARDVRRIALTAGLMVAILAVLHVLVNVLGVISF